MPKYRFVCTNCKEEKEQYAPSTVSSFPCGNCDSSMVRQMPKLSGAVQVNETIDPITNSKWKKDQEEMIKERQEDYYWSVEVPRFVQTYSVETCLEQGWMYVDDNGQLQVHTKPPHKR